MGTSAHGGCASARGWWQAARRRGARPKRAGMRWTAEGANAIVSQRCCKLSGRCEDFCLLGRPLRDRRIYMPSNLSPSAEKAVFSPVDRILAEISKWCRRPMVADRRQRAIPDLLCPCSLLGHAGVRRQPSHARWTAGVGPNLVVGRELRMNEPNLHLGAPESEWCLHSLPSAT